MTHEGQNLLIESVESDINQIKDMIRQNEIAKLHSIESWDREIKVLREYMTESQELLITLKNNR